MAEFYYDDGGSNTAPYDTWAKASTTMAAIIAGGLAAGDTIWVGNDSLETLVADATWTFPGTAEAPVKIVSVQKDTPPSVLLVGAQISLATTKTLTINGSLYALGVYFNLATTTGAANLRICSASASRQIWDNCKVTYVGTSGSTTLCFGVNGSAALASVVFKNSSIKFSATSQGAGLSIGGANVLWDNVTIDGTGSAVTTLFATCRGAGNILIQNCNLLACAQAVVLLPAASQFAGNPKIRNCVLPVSWSGTLVTGDAVTTPAYEAEMYNSDSGDTNYRLWKNNYYGKLVQETTLVATNGATDGTTRLSWKVTTTAKANKINPFEVIEKVAWNDTEGTQRTVSVEIISTALLTDSEAWIAANYSADTGDPLYQMASDRTADLIFTTPAAQTASTISWSDLVTARANSTGYAVNALIKCASNPGRVFICTASTGNSAANEPAGYATAVDGGSVTDGNCTFVAMYRQTLSVILPANMPANKGFIIGVVKVGKASTTAYIDMMKVV